MLIQQNVNGTDAFNRSWAEFKVGFNDTRGNYWLGNDLLSQLTESGRYKLRFDLQARGNLSWYWAEYSSFVVHSEATNYTLLVTGYSGNAGDALYWHDNAMFTTYDRDNDPWTASFWNNNCAVLNGGGFWYTTACSRASVNTVRGTNIGFGWFTRQRRYISLQSTRMWLMC